MKLNCVIVDDEPLAINLIKEHIEQTSFLTTTETFTHSVKAFEFLSQNRVDLIFVDIQMPDLTGLELVRNLEYQPVVIFTTAYDQYALEGFKVDAIDYLLKPINYPDFFKAAQKAKKWVIANNEGLKTDKEFLFVKSEYKILRVELNAIEYIEGMSEYVRIHRKSANPIMTLLSLKSLEEQLPADRFMRVHKSYIINLQMISEIESNVIICGDGVSIPISKFYRDAFKTYINDNFMS